MNIELQNITNLSVFDTIFMRKESLKDKCKYTFNSFLFFNGKDWFGQYWWGHEYLVACLWVRIANHHVLCSHCFSVK